MINEEEIVSLIREDKWMMEILESAKSLNLPDWWICAGFIRSKVWDILHDFSVRTSIPDIDVIYFDPTNIDKYEEKKIEKKLESLIPNIPWSVKNEARMHVKSNMSPYSSSVDAISKFPETATALGVKLDENDNVILTAPCGIHDVINLEVKPTPYFKETKERVEIYEDRITKKNWKSTWKKLKVNHIKTSS
ncbi:nucleotidyltransferase family protein [Peribacillus simplex]|uniref:Nucleotidyltransferase family protein n=3 Tax=Bacillaceae TaxID=186817 RepID=A0AA90SZ11_9BACI|nr:MULTISPECIES: nucleotidyltransferase family protein [Peribacillus]MDP1422151.1 nucleotidyltransferase family protein [Peribacillus simplex]MDP1454800.1 nucleotidyltransferase family protein [Peribacillus frigoritolerans]